MRETEICGHSIQNMRVYLRNHHAGFEHYHGTLSPLISLTPINIAAEKQRTISHARVQNALGSLSL